jgi:hypothetical protein
MAVAEITLPHQHLSIEKFMDLAHEDKAQPGVRRV